MANQNIKLTKDPLTNIHIMISMLDHEGCKAASTFLYGLVVGSSRNNRTDSKDDGEQQKAG